MSLVSRLNDLSFAMIWATGQAALRPLLSYRAEGPPPPRDGGLLVAANHLSFLDPVVLQMAIPRRIRFLMTEDFYDRPSVQWLFRWMRALRVREKGSNVESLREARDALRRGEVVALFPEGRLSRDGSMGRGRPGAAVLAQLGQVPILPMRIRGSYELMRRGMIVPRPVPIRVSRGRPIPPPAAGRVNRKALTGRIMEAIRAL